jgi:hypothetical protein
MQSVVIERPNEIALLVREMPDPGDGEWDLRHRPAYL